jgi:hypothetical protein
MKGIRGLLLLLCLLAWSPAAKARAAELVVSLALSSDLLPTRVCVRATKLGSELSSHAVKGIELVDAGKARFVETSNPSCAKGGDVCNQCSNPTSASGGVVCWLAERESPTSPKRDLQLQLDGAGVASLEVAGTDILIQAEVADGQPPRIKSLGGAYFPSFARAFSASGTLSLPLRNRCVDRFLSYSTDPLGEGEQDEAEVTTGLQKTPVAYVRKTPATLAVPEEGTVNGVELKRGSTIYSGMFSYPSNGPVELLATQFSFTWRKSAFVIGRREVDKEWQALRAAVPKNDTEETERWLAAATALECPRVWLVRPGRECSSQKPSSRNECRYLCKDLPPIAFPTRLRFELKPPRTALTTEVLKWEEDLRFPNASFTSLPPGAERRIYLIWPQEKSEPGRELDGLELTAPDGKTHHIDDKTTGLLVNSLQSPATFSYRYKGRGPFRTGTLRAHGDLLLVPASSASRQPVVLGALLHAGTLYRQGLDARQWSPTVDADLVALIKTRWELTLAGTFTYQPSELRVEGAPARWSSSPQVRLLVGAGWRKRVWEGCYFALGIGAGVATRAFESDWSRSKPWFASSVRARFGYEVSRALAFEPYVAVWWPERYVVRPQDAAGPRDPELRTTFSISVGAGLQWADVF